jgi:hypothetical protein
MKTGGERTFNEKSLGEMLSLKSQGWTYVKLAEEFGVHHSTIIYHCLKYGLARRVNRNKKKAEVLKESKHFYCVSCGRMIPGTESFFIINGHYCTACNMKANKEGPKKMSDIKLEQKELSTMRVRFALWGRKEL